VLLKKRETLTGAKLKHENKKTAGEKMKSSLKRDEQWAESEAVAQPDWRASYMIDAF
jgi:hypothetical protein